MIFGKNNAQEEGFLLVESLLTLVILMTIILSFCPFVVDWFVLHREAAELVEENRCLYECSMNLKNNQSEQKKQEKYTVEVEKNSIKIKETGTEVFIYESSFEK